MKWISAVFFFQLILFSKIAAQTTYLWSNGATTATIDVSPLVTTTYFVTITNNGINYFESLVVEVDSNPIISGTDLINVGSTCQLSGSGTPALFNPWTSSNEEIATVSSSGLVTGISSGSSVITYTNIDGCSVTFTVYVIQPSSFALVNNGENIEDPSFNKILSFVGECSENNHLISWYSEIINQNESTILQFSTDNKIWYSIEEEVITEKNSEATKISYQKQNSESVSLFYRLIQTSLKGDLIVSNPILVSCKENDKIIKTYPNPSNSSFNLLISDTDFVGDAIVLISDSKGKEVARQNVQISEGTNLILFEEILAKGLYYIQIKNGTINSKLLKHVIQ